MIRVVTSKHFFLVFQEILKEHPPSALNMFLRTDDNCLGDNSNQSLGTVIFGNFYYSVMFYNQEYLLVNRCIYF